MDRVYSREIVIIDIGFFSRFLVFDFDISWVILERLFSFFLFVFIDEYYYIDERVFIFY